MKNFNDKTMLGTMELKNRFIRAAVGDFTNGGHLSDMNYDLYRRLAQGGAAALITGFAVVTKEEQMANIFSMADDELIPEYKKLTDIIHENGSKAIVQLVGLAGMIPTARPLGPSEGKNMYSQVDYHEMTQEEIIQMEDAFADAAERAVKAGFDGIEIHGSHGFLHHLFSSPLTNQRTDEYGGSVENRARFLTETVVKMRQRVGQDFPLLMKITVEDYGPNGITIEDAIQTVRLLSEAGLTAIETSGAWMSHKPKECQYYADAAKAIAEQTGCKVIQTGGNRKMEALKEELNTTNIDYFAFARPFVSETDWVNKFFAGEVAGPRCISCNFCMRNNLLCVFDKDKK